jgi:hypothetical protein
MAVTIRVLKGLDLVAEGNMFNPQHYYLRFTPAGMSIARELRRMRFQEPKPSAVRT